MQCPSCKQEISDNLSFCPFCGAKLLAATFATSAPEDVSYKKHMIVAILVALVVAACVIGAAAWWKTTNDAADRAAATQAADEALHSLHAVTISVDAPGWTDKATNIPVVILGTTADGTTVDQLQFIDGTGVGIQLSQGTYTASFPASPLLEDGTLYQDNSTTIELTLGADLEVDQPFAPKGADVAFVAMNPADVTDDQIARAAEYARKDSSQGAADKVPGLKDVAMSTKDKALADKQAAEQAAIIKAQEEAEAAAKQTPGSIYANEYFVVDLSALDEHVVSVDEKTDQNNNPVFMVRATMNRTKPDGTPLEGAGAGYEYTVDLAGTIKPASGTALPQLATSAPFGPKVTLNGNYTVYMTNAAG